MQNPNSTQQRIMSKIEELKLQLSGVSGQMETERNENSEEDSAIKQELLDKQEIIEQQILDLQASLQSSDAEISEYGKVYNLQINGVKRPITIVHPTEANPGEGKISLESPLAKALLGRKSGDTVEVDTPAGTQKYLLI